MLKPSTQLLHIIALVYIYIYTSIFFIGLHCLFSILIPNCQTYFEVLLQAGCPADCRSTATNLDCRMYRNLDTCTELKPCPMRDIRISRDSGGYGYRTLPNVWTVTTPRSQIADQATASAAWEAICWFNASYVKDKSAARKTSTVKMPHNWSDGFHTFSGLTPVDCNLRLFSCQKRNNQD